MISIQPLESAKGAADYYAAAFNYYAGDAQAMRWLGRGAEILKLGGVVEKEDMLQLLKGILPNGQVLQNKQGEHRPGFDMTFSAPKSVSILVGLGVDKDLEQFHDKAVELAIQQLEEEFAQTRIVKDGMVHFEQTNNFVIAAFRQPSSRANDPALHTHGVTMNMTFDKEGKARSLASDIHANRGVVEQLQRNVTYCGLLYRTHLANMLKGKGYQLTAAGDGLFEIERIPAQVLTEFSQRREEITQYMDDKGWSGAKAASRATLLTRDNKEEHDIHVLQESWKKRADELGFDGHQFVMDALTKEPKKSFLESLKESVFKLFYNKEELDCIKAREAVEVAIESVSQKSSVFELRQLKEYALKHSLTGDTVVSYDAINDIINQKINNQSLYVGKNPYTDQPVLTTPWLLTVEAETLARIDSGKGQVVPITSKKNVMDFQANYESSAKYPLTPSQKQAMIQFLTTSDRYMAIQGYAGTGKTTMLKLTRELAHASGFSVRGIAVSSSAANELTVKGGIHSDVFPIVHSELMRAPKDSLKKMLYVVDEASMLSSPQGHELIKLIEQKGARLFMVGDDAQLPSVKNGRIFGLSQEYGIHTASMTDNIRQRNQQLKESVHHAIDGEIYDAVRKLNEVRELKTHEERIETVAKKYLDLSPNVRENTLVFASTHANRREITFFIRKGLKEQGAIGTQSTTFNVLKPKALEEAQMHHAHYYSEGDVIRFNHQSKRFGIESGNYLKVDKITQDNKRNNSLKLIRSDGTSVTFRLNELPAYKSTRAGFNRHIEVYQPVELELTQGDRILWTRNFKKEGIANSERARVSGITNEDIYLTLDNGESKTLSLGHDALKHMDHGYVFTNMKVQGKDKMYGIGLVEASNKFEATLKNFYVQISRGIYSMTLITDDKQQLIRALERNDDAKKSSIDFVSQDQMTEHQSRFAAHSNSLNIDAIIEKKGIKSDTYIHGKKIIEGYRQAKNMEKPSVAAKMAHNILSNPQLDKLAKTHLGYGYQVYRNDAHRMQTSKLQQTLSLEERHTFNILKQYVRSVHNTHKARKQAIEINPTVYNKTHAYKESLKRNALASAIAADIERYKPYLKHYSIGQLNRIGLPQYLYGPFEQKAHVQLGRLTEYANLHEIYTNVGQFFSRAGQTAERGAQIKEQSKLAHPYLVKMAEDKGVTVDVLWKEINYKAKEHRDNLYKETLSEEGKNTFDQIKTYKTLGAELGALWQEHAELLDNNEPLPQHVTETIKNAAILRNEIASNLINEANAPILAYFKMDKDKLMKQADKHGQRNNVLQYMASKSHFQNKRDAAELISLDIKGHYPFIKELSVNSKQLNKFIRIISREQHLSSLGEAEQQDYKTVMHYKYQSKQAGMHWKQIFSLKEQNVKPNPSHVSRALEYTSKRDSLAAKIANMPQYAGIIDIERVSIEKINVQGDNHLKRITELNAINVERGELVQRLEQKATGMNAKEAELWQDSWRALNQKTAKVLSSQAIYQDALKDNPLIESNLSQKQLNVLEIYSVSLNTQPSKLPTNQQRHQSVDITITNEALMANPEQTYQIIFGEPKKSSSTEIRFSGGIIVSLKGSKAGLWYDFGSGEGGSPIQAIMRERGVDFKEALAIASDLAGTKGIDYSQPSFKRRIDDNGLDEKKILQNKIASAKSIMKGAVPIKNTLAQTYLQKHRGIEHTDQLNVKFWPKNAKWKSLDDNGNLIEKTNKIPALLIAAQNDKGEVTGVQRVYLDEKTGSKNTFMDKAKISKGHIKSSAGVLQKGEKFGTVYIAEGPETGASIATADPKATVLISFGLSNIKNLSNVIKGYYPSKVIIAGDTDSQPKSRTTELTEMAKKSLHQEGVQSTIIFPKKIQNLEKTDWNDVHKIQGIDEVKKQLGFELQHNKADIKINCNNLSNGFELDNIKNNTQLLSNNGKEYQTLISNEQVKLISYVDKQVQNKIDQIGKEKEINFNKSLDLVLVKKRDLSLEI